MRRYNIAVLGKSGVGKSTLINYLFGQSIRKTGTGEPVTERGFHPVKMEINELPVLLFDSWGLEPGKEKDWMEDLKRALHCRGIDKPAYKWFHSIFFCIAANHRVEELELEIIDRILSNSYPVTVVITKADMVSEAELQDMKKPIQEKFGALVNIVAVSSEEKKTRRGTLKPYGKEEIQSEIIEHFKQGIQWRLPERCIHLLKAYIDDWEEKERNFLYESTGLFKRKQPYEEMQAHLQALVKELNNGLVEELVIEEMRKTFGMYQHIAKKLNFDTNLPSSKLINHSFFILPREYDPSETVKIILKNIIFPIGIFTTKEKNYEKLCSELHSATTELKKEMERLELQIAEVVERGIDFGDRSLVPNSM